MEKASLGASQRFFKNQVATNGKHGISANLFFLEQFALKMEEEEKIKENSDSNIIFCLMELSIS